ncbi:MAG: DUF2877 domain-containing protein [Deltaproteobacteria bacterium]|nr:DUF2877 domain-containing protein [Deltaproteobacteria bacterium]
MVEASLIGEKARSLLAVPGSSGTVLAAFSEAIYLSHAGGELLWVTHHGLPAHRRAILVSSIKRVAQPGMDFLAMDGHLHIGDELVIDLSGTTVWSPPAVKRGRVVPLSIVNRCFQQLVAAFPANGREDGLGQLIPLASAFAAGEEMAGDFPEGSVVAKARGSVERIAQVCLRRDIVSMMHGLWELVGLGPGLTPSGDDFVGGLLFVAHCLNVSYPDEFGWENGAVGELLARAYTETNRISHTILSDLALGHGPQPLHHLMVSLLQGGQAKSIMPHIIQLLRIGHTSGWDLLAGFITGMLLTLRLPTT